jgi:PDZ domain-containing protein
MLSVLIASALAAAQSSPDTTASTTWRTAAAAATASSTAAGPIAEVAVQAPASAGVASPSNMVPTPPDKVVPPAGIAEIPSAASIATQDTSPNPVGSQEVGDPQQPNGEIARYQEEQSGMPPEQLKSLQQFNSEGELSTPFGMQLREAKRELKSGEDADGLLITAVDKGSPAAAAGLHPYNHKVHDAIAAAAMVGAVFSGGLSVVVIPALDYMQVGESYDMIIGVDGSRVTNFLDFQDRMRDLQPGEIVYLSVLRNGKRIQVTLPVTAATVQAASN